MAFSTLLDQFLFRTDFTQKKSADFTQKYLSNLCEN